VQIGRIIAICPDVEPDSGIAAAVQLAH
jgi:hypothetical protein